MLGINFLFILRKSVNFSVILSSKRKMNWTIVHCGHWFGTGNATVCDFLCRAIGVIHSLDTASQSALRHRWQTNRDQVPCSSVVWSMARCGRRRRVSSPWLERRYHNRGHARRGTASDDVDCSRHRSRSTPTTTNNIWVELSRVG